MASTSNNILENKEGILGTRVQAHAVGTAAAASLVAAPGTGLSTYLTDIIIAGTVADATVLFDDGTTTLMALPIGDLDATAAQPIHLKFTKPFKVGSNKALRQTAAVTTYITVLGFVDAA